MTSIHLPGKPFTPIFLLILQMLHCCRYCIHMKLLVNSIMDPKGSRKNHVWLLGLEANVTHALSQPVHLEEWKS